MKKLKITNKMRQNKNRLIKLVGKTGFEKIANAELGHSY